MPDHLSRPHMDRRLTERVERKKAELDRYRPLPQDTVRRLNDDLRIFLTYHSNAIEGNSLTLQETQMVIDYGITIHGHPLREYEEGPLLARSKDTYLPHAIRGHWSPCCQRR